MFYLDQFIMYADAAILALIVGLTFTVSFLYLRSAV
jgi:hypothetical protein